jgi:predicted TIM-barrel fold metal-dependent hydrolase
MAAREYPFIVDGHAHSAGEFTRGEDIVRTMDGLGVGQVVLCPGPLNEPKKWPVPDLTGIIRKRGLGMVGNRLLRLTSGYVRRRFDFEANNEYVAGLARRHPGRIVQACWVDPARTGLTDWLATRQTEWKFKVLKVHQCFQRFKADSPGMHDLARFAGATKIPVFIHLFSRRDALDLIKLIAAHPGTTFVIAHVMGLGAFSAAADRDALRNVHFDTSPPNLTPLGLIEKALRIFGAGRLLLGSDTPYGKNNLAAAIARVRGLNISEEEKSLILGGNARRIYSL